jgi:glycosyltransferase involved in cell wall biosynthesis
MRLLVLSPLLPTLAGSGGHSRELNLLRRVAERGHEVVVCCPVPQAQREAVAATRAAGLDVRPSYRPPSRAREALAAIARRPALAAGPAALPLAPWQLEVLWQGLEPQVGAALRERPFDVALVVWDLAAAWRRHLPGGLPAVLGLHDVSPEYAATRARTAHGARAPAWRIEAARLRRFDARWLPRYERVVCVSDEEAARVLAIAPGARPAVVPNGVDVAAFTPAEEQPGPPTVLFTGTMNYRPNAEGALWLATEAWPRLRASRPDARLLIVGRDPTAAVRRLHGRDGVEVLGAVPDMAPWFAAAHVVAVPVRSGGGTRLKVLEAAAAGRPIVSTALGAEGIDLRDGREIVLADDPPAFASALAGLLADPARRREVASAARAVVVARYGWPALGDRLSDVLEEAAEPTARTSSTGTTTSTSSPSTT